MGLLFRLGLAMEFGIGPKARAEKQAFLKANGGIKGLKKAFREGGGLKGGGEALKQKVNAFRLNKGRPGQNNHLTPNKKGDEPKAKDTSKPDANKEWDKKDTDKLDKLKSDTKHFKPFEAKNKEDAIKEINDARSNKDIAKLRGIVDKALSNEKLTTKEKLAAFGFGDKGELVVSGNANAKGEFGLYKSSDTKSPFAKVSIGDKGEFKYESLAAKPDAMRRPGDLERDILAEKVGTIKDLDHLKSFTLLYENFDAKNSDEAKKIINESHRKNHQPSGAGILDKVLDQVLSTKTEMTNEQKNKFKLTALGFPNKERMASFTNVNDKNEFQIFLNGNSKEAVGLIKIQDDGSFKYEAYKDQVIEINSQ